jgi:hypothetical protein
MCEMDAFGRLRTPRGRSAAGHRCVVLDCCLWGGSPYCAAVAGRVASTSRPQDDPQVALGQVKHTSTCPRQLSLAPLPAVIASQVRTACLLCTACLLR